MILEVKIFFPFFPFWCQILLSLFQNWKYPEIQRQKSWDLLLFYSDLRDKFVVNVYSTKYSISYGQYPYNKLQISTKNLSITNFNLRTWLWSLILIVFLKSFFLNIWSWSNVYYLMGLYCLMGLYKMHTDQSNLPSNFSCTEK